MIRSLSSSFSWSRRGLVALFATVGPVMMLACSHGSGQSVAPDDRITGQSEFVSAPLAGRGGGKSFGAGDSTAGDAGATPPAAPGAGKTDPARKVEETDLYRLDGDRLYYLNAYRGLMVFDVADVAHPKLLGRSPIFGSPVEMIVRGGIATVIVADWYGTMEDGKPFHGSIVRGIDARDPASIKITGEAKLGGWVRDSRVVGDVLYAVSEDYGWYYGWDGYYGDGVAYPGGYSGSKLVVSAVSFKDGAIATTGWKEFPGYSGIFNVTPDSIMLAHDVTTDSGGYPSPTGRTELQYIDISDPGGTIALRGKLEVNGRVQGWGADNGRWNVDFADGAYAHTIGCGNTYCGGTDGYYVLSTADFRDADHPVLASELRIAATGWSPAARFDNGRMYLSPTDGWYYGTKTSTPIQVYDISNPATPRLAGSTEIAGNVWNFIPSKNRLFALGNDYDTTTGGYYNSKVTLRYLDVTDMSKPLVLGTSSFGDGWAWTPAAGTFKAFTKDDAQGLVVLPFSGWSSKDGHYNNGVQLIEYTDSSLSTAGHANSHGWVERGIFVKGRIVSLSDLALTVVDYSDRANPKPIAELTLARNVVNAKPQGATISQLSSDWWDNDLTSSEYRVLPIADAEENQLDSAIASLTIDGVNARVFHNGSLAYVVSNVRSKVACPAGGGGGPYYPGGEDKGGGTGDSTLCDAWTQQVSVVDLSGGKATLRGKVALPIVDGYSGYGWWGWGWWGCWYYDWYDGDDVVQVNGDALAFRRWIPGYGPDGKPSWSEAKNALYVVDLKDPNAPSLASVTITDDPTGWWGNMRAVGDKLYTTHYEWVEKPIYDPSAKSYVKYYLDQIDLSDRSRPKVGAKINVPGVLVGASQTDPSLLYTIDYRWYGDRSGDELSVVKVVGDKAYLQGTLELDGWTGKVIVKGNTAYLSSERYTYSGDTYTGPRTQLHAIDLADPTRPVDRIASEKKGWGWLLGIEGDRAVVTSGWGQSGVDVYKLTDGSAPVFDQFVRTRGWWSSSLSRQDDQLFLASGYWGVQAITLK
jgi:hypothetical protein